MDYLKALQYIAHVDKDDNILGKVERWEAHEKGILHRAFTISISYEDKLLLQHRKHPVFDGIYDVTISSHPLYVGETLEDPVDAVYRTLQREWNILPEDLDKQPSFQGKCYYQAADPKSLYQEHEVCHIYTCNAKKLTMPSLETAYGFSLMTIAQIQDNTTSISPLFAPWVRKMIEDKLL